MYACLSMDLFCQVAATRLYKSSSSSHLTLQVYSWAEAVESMEAFHAPISHSLKKNASIYEISLYEICLPDWLFFKIEVIQEVAAVSVIMVSILAVVSSFGDI